MLTFNDVNRDFKAIFDGVSDANRVVPSTAKAVMVALILPMIGITLSTLTFGVLCAGSNHRNISISLLVDYILSGDAIPVYMSMVIGFLQVIILLPYIVLYHSIPQSIREKTPLITYFKKALFKGVVLYICTLLMTCLMSYHNPIYLFSTPVVMCIAIFATSMTFNLQMAKYGVGPLIHKLNKTIR
ncbi:hypothetical protein LO291_004098 [Salmonella enterica]|nr:hypothetical protein [Salmonella enterica]EIO0148812.1 hypothetical protein [Salmonella enterica]